MDDGDDDDTDDDHDDDDDDTDDDNDHKNDTYTAAGAAPGASVPVSSSMVTNFLWHNSGPKKWNLPEKKLWNFHRNRKYEKIEKLVHLKSGSILT